MSNLRHMLLAWILAVPAVAATVSVTNQSTVTLHSGEALVFGFLESSYATNARLFKAPADPERVSFSFSTFPLDGWDFAAELRSGDGSSEASFDGEALANAAFAGTYYRGPVSNAYGSMGLSPELSRLIFAGPLAYLVLRNIGADVDLGLQRYTLAQDMRITLSGGGLSVGGLVASVALEPAVALQSGQLDSPGILLGQDSANVPEPGTAALFASGALLVLWRTRKRAS